MHTRDYIDFLKIAQKVNQKKDEQALSVGEATKGLSIILDGFCHEVRDGELKPIASGSMWGELTYVLGDGIYNKSPVSIVCDSDSTILHIPYAVLRSMSAKNTCFEAALQNGFMHSAGFKHGLLKLL